jgi:hypothetical protein
VSLSLCRPTAEPHLASRVSTTPPACELRLERLILQFHCQSCAIITSSSTSSAKMASISTEPTDPPEDIATKVIRRAQVSKVSNPGSP